MQICYFYKNERDDHFLFYYGYLPDLSMRKLSPAQMEAGAIPLLKTGARACIIRQTEKEKIPYFLCFESAV